MQKSGVVRRPWWWDLEDDQYIGEFEDDDDGANAAEWEDSLEDWEVDPEDDDTMYPDGMDIEEENTKAGGSFRTRAQLHVISDVPSPHTCMRR